MLSMEFPSYITIVYQSKKQQQQQQQQQQKQPNWQTLFYQLLIDGE